MSTQDKLVNALRVMLREYEDDVCYSTTLADEALALAAAPQPQAAEPVGITNHDARIVFQGSGPPYRSDLADVARYRWLRDMRNRELATTLVSFKMNLDAAIDAAMAKESGR